MLSWASRFNIFCFLDNSHYASADPDFECLLAAAPGRSITLSDNPFEALRSFYDEAPGWLFGHMGYDLNNNKQLVTARDGFCKGFFFTPNILLRLTGTELIVETGEDHQQIFNAIEHQTAVEDVEINSVHIQSRLTENEYISVIHKIKAHIQRGDCYELNFCQEFFSDNSSIDPLQIFIKLQEESPNPFSAFYKVNESYCLCASPERFLKKTGQQLMSQPIKGTAKRGNDPASDEKNKSDLRSSQKEKSENVMIVDLVRNDLSRVCMEGSVYVEELFGIYSFPQVHQMISTIKGTLSPGVHWTQALAATFPMGSMTGAPKKRVIELIAQYEHSSRGLFSGSIGYISPHGDFDFNVVIRSIFYNKDTRYLSFWAGGGITFYSDPVLEYEESLVKAKAMREVLK